MSLRRRFITIVGAGLLPAGLLVAGPGLASAAVAGPVSSSAASAAVVVPASAPAEDAEGKPSQEAEALAQAQATGEPVEVTSEATETETVTANPDGTLTLSTAVEPVRVENEAGDLVDIDTTLTPNGDQLETVATTTDVTLDADGAVGGTDPLAQVTDPESGVSVGLSFGGALAAPVVEGSSATYAQDADISVRVSSNDDGFAAHVILDRAPASAGESGGPVYRFPLLTQGATARLVEGVVEFVDPAGAVVASTSTLRMWDAQVDEFGDPSNVAAVDAVLVEDGGTQVLELRPDPEYLADPATEYPVVVDPDVRIDSSETSGTTYVTNGAPTESFNGDSSLRVGSNDGTSQNESWVTFPTEKLAGQTVTDATLRLYQYGAGVCEPRRIEARMTTSDWTGRLRSWNNRPTRVDIASRFATSATFNASGPGGGTPACGGAAWQDIDVTGQVSTWVGNTAQIQGVTAAPRYGIMLTTPAGRELNTGFEKRFCADARNTTGAGRCQEDNVQPTLDITYTPYLGDQSWYSVTERKLDERSTLKVNHQSGNTYVAGNDVQVSSVGMDLALGRRYNSQAETTGQFGPKWTMSGGPDVWLEKIDQWRYVYHTPDGAELGPFTREADATGAPNNSYRKFTTPLGGLGADLVENDDTTFTLTFHSSQEKYVFTQMGTQGDLFQSAVWDRAKRNKADATGNTITYDYATPTTSDDPRLASVTDTAGRTYQITYGNTGAANGFITQVREANGPQARTWTYDYTDQSGARLTGYTDPEDDTTTYNWVQAELTAAPVIETITDPANDSGLAPMTTLTTLAGQTTAVAYAGESATEMTGYGFAYQTNVLARCGDAVEQSAIVTSQESSMGVTTYCFNERNNGPLDENANNMSTTVYDAQGDTRSQSYSPDNQPEVFADDAGAETVNTYGNAGSGLADQLRKTDQAKDSDSATGTGSSYQYKAGNSVQGDKYLPTSMVDASGDCTAYRYDSEGRVTDTYIGRDTSVGGSCDNGDLVTGGNQYQSAYNGDGTVAWMSDPNSNNTGAAPTEAQKTKYTYWAPSDAGFVAGTRGQVKSMQRPGGDCATGATRALCTSYTYDGLSRTLTETDGRGEVTRSAYDVMDRTTESLSNGATSCDTTSGECITYDYDAAGNLIERVDSQGSTTFDFDRQNRRTRQATPDGVEVSYAYNRDSRMTGLTQALPGQTPDTVAYVYDNTGQLNSVTDAAGTINTTYDGQNRLSLTTFPTAPALTLTERTYTSAGLPKKIETWSGTRTNDQMTDYEYTYTTGTDGNKKDTNRLQKLVVKNSPASVKYDASFNYNSSGQLTAENRTGGGGPSSSFTYDNAGNIATIAKNGTTTHFGYDQANQLCWTGPTDGPSPVATCPATAPGTSKVVARDKAGNSEGDPDAPIDYNPRDQATDIDGQEQGYYDQGNDLQVTTGVTHLVNANPGITARTTNTDGTGAPTGTGAETTFYTRMPDGRLLSSRGPDGTHYYLTDENKTVLNLIDDSGQRAGTYRYDPYGQATLVEATPAEAANPFRWISGYQDNTDMPGGYIKLGARFYNPTTGAFTQPDPEMGNMGEPLRLNAYLYSAGDPINNTDSSGRFFDDIGDSISDAYNEFSYATDIASGVSALTGSGAVAIYGGYLACTAFTAGVCAVAAPVLAVSAGAAFYSAYQVAEEAY